MRLVAWGMPGFTFKALILQGQTGLIESMKSEASEID